MAKKTTKDKRICFRLTENEHKLLMQKVEESGLSITNFLIQTALKEEFTKAQIYNDCAKELRKIGVNINQLIHEMHKQGLNENQILEVRKEQKKIWLYLKRLQVKLR